MSEQSLKLGFIMGLLCPVEKNVEGASVGKYTELAYIESTDEQYIDTGYMSSLDPYISSKEVKNQNGI